MFTSLQQAKLEANTLCSVSSERLGIRQHSGEPSELNPGAHGSDEEPRQSCLEGPKLSVFVGDLWIMQEGSFQE